MKTFDDFKTTHPVIPDPCGEPERFDGRKVLRVKPISAEELTDVLAKHRLDPRLRFQWHHALLNVIWLIETESLMPRPQSKRARFKI